MQDLTGKTTGSSLTAAEWNQLPQEVQNVITAIGITLSAGDLNQLGKALATYAPAVDFYVGGGTADAHVLSIAGGKQGIANYQDGAMFRFRPVASNLTTTPTVNINGRGVKTVIHEDGTALLVGELNPQRDAFLRFDSADPNNIKLLDISLSLVNANFPRGYISGFLHANDVTDQNNDISVGTGVCRDDANSMNMIGSAMIKRIDANWVAGSGNGGFPTALTLSPDTWYRFFAIGNPTTSAVDYGWDTSSIAANLLTDATGFTTFRQIAWHYRTAGLIINRYRQNAADPSVIMWNTPSIDVNEARSTTPANKTVLVPPDAIGIFSFMSVNNAGFSTGITDRLYDPDNPTDPAVVDGNTNLQSVRFAAGEAQRNATVLRVKVNSSSQVRVLGSITQEFRLINTQGYVYGRGRE